MRSAERGHQLAPADPASGYTLTRALIAARSRHRAEQVAQEHRRLSPAEPLTWEALTLAALARRRWREAEERARQGLALAPADSDLLVLLGVALAGRHRTAEATEKAFMVLRADPADPRGRELFDRLVPRLGVMTLGLLFVVGQGMRVLQDGDPVVAAFVVPVAAVFAGLIVRSMVLSRREYLLLNPATQQVVRYRLGQRGRVILVRVGVVLVLVAVAVLAFGERLPGTGYLLVACAVLASAFRLPRPPAGRVARRVQSIRRRFR